MFQSIVTSPTTITRRDFSDSVNVYASCAGRIALLVLYSCATIMARSPHVSQVANRAVFLAAILQESSKAVSNAVRPGDSDEHLGKQEA